MASIIKVDQIQLSNGTTPNVSDLGINLSLTQDDLPAGSVVQTVYLNDKSRTQVSLTSTSYTNTGIAVTITPKYSNSLFKITVNFLAYFGYSATDGFSCVIDRNGTAINDARDEYSAAHNMSFYTVQNGEFHIRQVHDWIDQPNTGSTLTYTIFGRSYNGNAVYLFNGGHQYVHMSVQEIKQ